MELNNISHFKKWIAWVICFAAVSAIGVYFRLYPLHQGTLPDPEKMARVLVENNITQQFLKSADFQANASAAADDKVKWAHEQAQRMIASDPGQYQKAVAGALENLKKSMPVSSGRRYLLEADPYYYFFLTRQIMAHGRIAEKIRGSQYYHPLMHAPFGYWTAMTWHPYVGWAIGSVILHFQPQMEWMAVLAWVPIVLTIFVIILFLILAKVLEFEVPAIFVGGAALVLSPIFIQRSGYGWYDTDPYNYLFPFAVLACVLAGMKGDRRSILWAVIAGILTGAYSMFWTGWLFLFFLVPAAWVAAYVVTRFIPGCLPQDWKAIHRFSALYAAVTAVAVVLFLTPQGLKESLTVGWTIMRKFSLSEPDVWPNIFLTVGEAKGITVKKLIYLSGNYITFFLAVAGIILEGIAAYRSRISAKIMRWLFLFFFTVPLFYMSIQTERFGVLFVIPLSIWVLFGAERAIYYAEKIPEIFLQYSPWRHFKKLIASTLVIVVFMPLPLLMAHIVSIGVKPIMDDAWYATMRDLAQKTPPAAIVNSWWPPGYFVLALAQRRVVADGGTQQLQECYWLARLLAAEDEKEAAGILRMLNISGNSALLFLKAFGMQVADAVDLLNHLIVLPRAVAEQALSANMPKEVREKLLDLTHGRQGDMPPSYVLVYQDLIEQNLAVTTIARWDFRKALEMQKNKTGSSDYVGDFLKSTGAILKYLPPVKARAGTDGIVSFSNGLHINLNEKDAFLADPVKNVHGKPQSLFYLEDGQLQEKPLTGATLPISALLVKEQDGEYTAVLADAHLIRSLMFRLYYLNGVGLHLFKPFSDYNNPAAGNRVAVFEFLNGELKLAEQKPGT